MNEGISFISISSSCFCSSLSDDPEVGPGDGHRQKAQAKAEELPYSDRRERKR
ncbi:MAG: hypothetical protein IJB85_13195 [Clostridia bacterium]|nr:hypothetical protein [Clostridia bacterium]